TRGSFTGRGALGAHQRPDEPSVLQQFPLLPAYLKPPIPVTNLAAYAYAFDETYAPDTLALIQLRAGQLAASGDPRGWQDGELTPIRRFARAWAANRPNATEWYYPRRLLLDIDAASPLRQNAAARVLGLRLLHADEIDVPLYAYGTALAQGGGTRGARRLALRAHTGRPLLVDDRDASHLDPLSAAPKRNRFLKTVVAFLLRR